MRKDKPYDRSVYRSLTLVLQFGFNMLVPIGMMTALGIYLDQQFDTKVWTIILFFIGAIAGGQNVYRMAKSIYDSPADRERKGKGITDGHQGVSETEK